VLAACAAHLRGRHALNARWIAAIAESTRLPIVRLPRRADGARGRDALAALGALLTAKASAA
jgi:hypothetical protein